MSSSRTEESLLETTEEQELDGNDAAKLVPVTESIRYRKRAQSAEKKSEGLAEQLADANHKIAQMSQDLSDLQTEQKLVRKLAAAGDVDFISPIAVLPYEGRKYYRYQSEPLQDGRYIFAVRAESATKMESPSQTIAECEIKTGTLGEPGILDAEAI